MTAPPAARELDPAQIRCVVFDFGFTLSSDLYFTTAPPPAAFPHMREVVEREVFARREVVHAWMRGEIGLRDVARIALAAGGAAIEIDDLVRAMEAGCRGMRLNPAVWDLARAQRRQGRATALVTANMDVFTTVVRPDLRLDEVFDIILNTSDAGDLRKEPLWDRALAQLGATYPESLLVEDGPHEPALFRARGGHAHQYEGDGRLLAWLAAQGWEI